MTDGIIDFQSNNSGITYSGSSSHIINNYGLIKKTTTEGTTSFIAQLINHNGTIQVETGTLTLNNANTTLDSGTYNVSEDGSLNWNSTVFMTGTLTGELTGGINWNGNVSVAEDTTATFNFTGANAVRWTAGSLVGGGTLENLSKINLTTATAKYITGATTLNNIGLINVLDGTQWYLSNSVINNMTDGIIDFQSSNSGITYSGSSSHIINNYGLIKKTTAEGTTTISVTANNSGEMRVLSGTLRFTGSFNNQQDGIITGNATLQLPSSAFTNSGTFSPGVNAPATLSVLGNYTSTENTVLEIDINGLTQGTDYDLLSIQGNAVMIGNVVVNLGFDAAINDEFIVSTITGTITQCELNPVAVSEFNGYTYTFDVECVNNNSVILRVTNKTLGIEELIGNSLKVYPNPVTDILQIDNRSSVQIVSITIFDISGRKLTSFETTDNFGYQLNLTELNAGQYLMKLNFDGGQVLTKKLLKK
jgi:hypothetical protein